MKLSTSALIISALSSTESFSPICKSLNRQATTAIYGMQGMDLSGNSWKPEGSEVNKMGSTDTGDYFPEDYDANAQPDFSEGMLGSQAGLGDGNKSGPELPGMENLGDDAIMMGGIEENSDIPVGMEFVPASVPDREFQFQVAANSKGGQMEIEVKPFCMSFEDFYAAFAPGSHPSLKVSPCAGRMDRRGGEATYLNVSCEPGGQAGTFIGDLVVNLPEDNSKLTYKISCTSF
mmetsp:Transcript_21371/g.26232  ORF Transcript_21371/g.26232 Transcript_21371/m.26232 type:complete len:233 (-) Transcript_21371:138-836(-)